MTCTLIVSSTTNWSSDQNQMEWCFALSSIAGCYPREMPGLRLTLDQIQRLCGIERTVCKMALDMLVETNFLCVKPDGA